MVTRNGIQRAVLIVLVTLLLSGSRVPILAQEGGEVLPLILIVERGLGSSGQQYAAAFAVALQTALAAGEPRFTVETYPAAATEHMTAAEFDPAPVLLIELRQPCAAVDSVQLTFWVNAGADALLSPDLQTALLNADPLFLRATSIDPVTEAVQVSQALASHAGGSCATAPDSLDALAIPPALEPDHAYLLKLYRALCHHAGGEWAAVIDLLLADEMTPDTSLPWQFARLRDIYMADALAQSFAFTRALSWDDRAIRLTQYGQFSGDPRTPQLLAELYLLRGQHRLYQYAWDAVLDDYNAALATEYAPPRAYYLRGTLYYTVGEYPAAYADFTHFLALDVDPDDPEVSAAQGYVADLERILATPTPE